MRKTSCTGSWNVRGPRTAETGCTVLGRFHQGRDVPHPKHRGRGFPYKGEYSGQREVQRGLGNRDGMFRDLPAITRGGMHRTQGQRSHGGGLSVQIGPLERRVVMGATGPESRDGMHRTLSQATGTVETTYPIKSEDVPRTRVLGGSGSESGDRMHRALPLAARKVDAEKKKREQVKDTRERMRKGMLKELDDRLESMGKLEVEESGKVLEQCKWTDIYQED